MADVSALDEFPRQFARTRYFSLGVPRSFNVSPDGSRVVFLRSKRGDDPVTCLWSLDVATGAERCLVDPRELAPDEDESQLTDAERARRERARELAEGVTAYATDQDVRRAVFVLSGRLFLADLVEGGVRELPTAGSADDPQLDPTGTKVAYVVSGALHVLEIDGVGRVLAADDDPDISWGLAEFAAAEEMDRSHGCWWSPDGSKLAATRVDERPVRVWYIGDPTDPAASPRAVRFPQAGTDNADVSLHVFDVATGDRVEVAWDRESFPYLARANWSEGCPLTVLVQSRDQRLTQLVEIDVATGAASLLREERDEHWVDLIEDAPVRLSDGRLVTVVADEESDTNRLAVGFEPITLPGLQVRRVISGGDSVLFTASEEPTEIHLWRWSRAGSVRLSERPGVYSGAEGGDVTVLVASTPDEPAARVSVLRGGRPAAQIPNVSERPVVRPRPIFLSLGERELRAALLLPGSLNPDQPIPVLMDPYAGPRVTRVLCSLPEYTESQWFADHGFAVLAVDGRGTPGRGPRWEREVSRDFGVVLEDQVDALRAAGEQFPFLDLSRVGIRGWSFGGYLSAMAVLRRPDVFHAAVAGAPVTDLRWYDTHYTERYLGHPAEEPDVYTRNSILADASRLERPPSDPRPVRRQRLRRSHPGAVGRSLRGRVLPRARAPSERHPHDAFRGRDRERPSRPARLPPPFARDRRAARGQCGRALTGEATESACYPKRPHRREAACRSSCRSTAARPWPTRSVSRRSPTGSSPIETRVTTSS
jgi:dipeptidyl-peptidase-4